MSQILSSPMTKIKFLKNINNFDNFPFLYFVSFKDTKN